MNADVQGERGTKRQIRRRRERRQVVGAFDIHPRPGMRLWRPPRRGRRGEPGRVAKWLRGGAELYGPPFYFLLGLGAAAVVAGVYVAIVAPARAREQAALREKLERRMPADAVGVLQEPDAVEAITGTEASYPQVPPPQARLTEDPPLLDLDGEPIDDIVRPSARRVNLIPEETLDRVDDLAP